MLPGPERTENSTPKPELAVALNSTRFVAHWSPIAGNDIAWLPFATTTDGFAPIAVRVPPLCFVCAANA